METEAVTIRKAEHGDVPAIVAMFASDSLGGHGDTTDPAALPGYMAAFRRIEKSPNETLYVAIKDGEVVGTFQTLITTTLTGRGGSSMIVEAVHTRTDCRGQGIGEAMVRFCLEEARRQGLRKVQLTSNAKRTDAHRFYGRLGFEASHLGFKLTLK
ncbi:GNAT family N-acetyltransferase [Ciceribacter sp. RN22]|uniref:GNAT family N-acetyltransferase n=1 Tax=Ciceribacter sp. RN22 TaxID=2954932 RepID=UPI002093B29D|nr:GNAT family N-acetyltransferase [Ciceribacter sp. RN22]MCO6177938.1 GNAT family N-acetyltransferase [Ciceribacter sp. RN22]